jgi:hypothetical protein
MHIYKSIELLGSYTFETRGLGLVYSSTPLPFDLHMCSIIYSFYGARSNGIKDLQIIEFEFEFKGFNGKVCGMCPLFEFSFTTIIFDSGGKFKVFNPQNHIAN